MVRDQLKFALYVLFHPFKGFWDMKFEHRGKLATAWVVLLLLAIVAIAKLQFAGFIVNKRNPDDINSLAQIEYVLLPFFLWCIANWSTTTLMDGEGKFTEIIMATGYALVPMVLIYVPQVILSNVITKEEGAFYYFLDTLAIIWVAWLLFIGTMTVHQYTAGKTIATIVLTLLVIGIILFIGLLFFSLLQQMLAFGFTIYREMMLRS